MEELWFSKPKQVGFKEDSQGADIVSKNNLSNLAAVIMTVTGTATGDRPPPVDDLLRQVSNSIESPSMLTIVTTDLRQAS